MVIMKTLKDYLLLEVSEKTAKNAENLAIADIKKLSDEFAASKFKDMDILAKLQKRARQVDVFRNYAENINTKTAEGFSSEVKKVIEKWNDGRELSNGAKFMPLFVLTSGQTFDWGKVRGWGKEEWNEHINELEMIYLTVVGLNSDFSGEKKIMKKVGADTSGIEAIEKEYEDINNELKEDLSKVKGLAFKESYANRKSSKAVYNTIVMSFEIDKKLINIEKASELLPGNAYTNIGSTKIDRGSGSDNRGRFNDIYRTREKSQKLN